MVKLQRGQRKGTVICGEIPKRKRWLMRALVMELKPVNGGRVR